MYRATALFVAALAAAVPGSPRSDPTRPRQGWRRTASFSRPNFRPAIGTRRRSWCRTPNSRLPTGPSSTAGTSSMSSRGGTPLAARQRGQCDLAGRDSTDAESPAQLIGTRDRLSRLRQERRSAERTGPVSRCTRRPPLAGTKGKNRRDRRDSDGRFDRRRGRGRSGGTRRCPRADSGQHIYVVAGGGASMRLPCCP